MCAACAYFPVTLYLFLPIFFPKVEENNNIRFFYFFFFKWNLIWFLVRAVISLARVKLFIIYFLPCIFISLFPCLFVLFRFVFLQMMQYKVSFKTPPNRKYAIICYIQMRWRFLSNQYRCATPTAKHRTSSVLEHAKSVLLSCRIHRA